MRQNDLSPPVQYAEDHGRFGAIFVERCGVLHQVFVFCYTLSMRFSPIVRKRFLMNILFTIFISIVLPPPISHAAYIEGRVFNEVGPMKGAKVYVYKTYEDIRAGASFVTSEPADGQGQYKLQLPEGEYYFTARGNMDGKEFFSYLGGNPVNVGTQNIWVAFLTNESKPPVYSNGATSVRGVVTYKGKPVRGALIAFYTSENRKFKGIGYRTEQVNEDGTFDFSVPPNNYVVIARKRDGENGFGPLRNGDLYCYYAGNPLEVKSGRIAQIEVPCYPKVERTAFVASPKIKTNNYKTVQELAGIGFGIKGRVMNSKGEAVKGIYVLAYRVDPSNTFALSSTFRGTHETENISKTDDSGNYFIPLDADGNYVVMARYRLGGGTPKVDEIYGFYNSSTRKGVPFRKGQVIDDVDITVVTPTRQSGRQGKRDERIR
jgi:hypothetical protein